MNEECGGKAGYYFSSTCTLAGSVAMFLIDVHRRRIARHKHTKANGQRHLCESDSCPRRRPSIGAEPEPEPQISELPVAELIQGAPGEKPELTCISEEGIADMDLPDNLLDDLDYIGITSCNKVNKDKKYSSKGFLFCYKFYFLFFFLGRKLFNAQRIRK